MNRSKVLIIGSELLLCQNIQSILENEGYEVIINLVIADSILQQIETINPQLVLIDNDIKGKISSTEIGKYLLNADLIPFMYISSVADNITLEQIKVTRPYGFLVKPIRRSELNALVKIILYNYSHKHLDLLKTDKKVIEDVPYRIRHVINYINDNIYEKIDIDELTKLTKWKKHHFIRIFHSIIGNTPYQYPTLRMYLRKYATLLPRIVEKQKKLKAQLSNFEVQYFPFNNSPPILDLATIPIFFIIS